MSDVRVSLGAGMKTTVTAGKHVFHADEPVDSGGTDEAGTPMQIMLGALGSCIAITMKMYADRKEWDLQGVDISLESERFNGKDYADYDGDERYVHEVRENIVLHGDLDDKQRERLLDIAKKCPVARLVATPTFWKQQLLEGDTLPE